MPPTLPQKIGAMSVHLFTTSGIIAGFYAIVNIAEGDFKTAFWLLLLCQVIDGIDGTFARIFKVTETLPWMDGKMIDYVVDFCTYAVIPTYLIYQSQVLPPEVRDACTCLILLVSGIYYGKSGMVSDDMHFVGFPVMWNFAAFFLVFVHPEYPWWNAFTVLVLSILHFVPIKFAYPSRKTPFFVLQMSLVSTFGLSVLGILTGFPLHSSYWEYAIITAVAGFLGLAIYTTWFAPSKEIR